MKTINQERIDALSDTCGELVDHRSAVCFMLIIELTSYDDVHVVTEHSAPDVYNVTFAPSSLDALPLLSAVEFDDELEAVAYWCNLISERAEQYVRAG
jgi:hypothetical protein